MALWEIPRLAEAPAMLNASAATPPASNMETPSPIPPPASNNKVFLQTTIWLLMSWLSAHVLLSLHGIPWVFLSLSLGDSVCSLL